MGMYARMCVYIDTLSFIYFCETHVRVYTNVHIYIHSYTYTDMYVCMYIHNVYVYIHVCIYTYKDEWKYTYVRKIHGYTYTHEYFFALALYLSLSLSVALAHPLYARVRADTNSIYAHVRERSMPAHGQRSGEILFEKTGPRVNPNVQRFIRDVSFEMRNLISGRT